MPQPSHMPDDGADVLISLLHAGVERLHDRFDGFDDKLEQIDWGLRGKDGKNGLYGRMNAAEKEIEKLKRSRHGDDAGIYSTAVAWGTQNTGHISLVLVTLAILAKLFGIDIPNFGGAP